MQGGNTNPQIITASVNTFNHNPGAGKNRLLMVSVVTGATTSTGNNAANAAIINSVTFGGQPLTLVSSARSPSGGNGSTAEVRVYLYMLREENFPTGSGNVVVTAATSSRIIAGAISFSNVNQETPLGTPNSVGLAGNGAANSIGISINQANPPGQLVHAVVGVDADGAPISITDAQTPVGNMADSLISAAISNKSGSRNLNMSWSWTGNQLAAAVAVPIIGSSITFNGSGQDITGNIYAPGVPIMLGNLVNFSPPGSSANSAGNKPGLAE